MTDQPTQAENAGTAAPVATSPEGATPAAAGTEQPTRTAEDVEKGWQKRHSDLGRQHAAEVATLQEQLKSAQGEQSTATSQAKAASTDVETLQKQLAAEQKGRSEDQQGYAQTIRSTKYPYAAEALDAQSLASMDEAKLAGLNARLTPDTSTPPIASSTPAKNSAATKPTADKTADELKADLKRMSPQFAESLSRR